MHVDMTCLGAHHSLMRTQERINHAGIGLSAADKEADPTLRNPAFLKNQQLCPAAMVIKTVTRRRLHVGPDNALQDTRMRPADIITFEMKHNPYRIKKGTPAEMPGIPSYVSFTYALKGISSAISYQLAFFTPGIRPAEAISRNWIREMPNWRI